MVELFEGSRNMNIFKNNQVSVQNSVGTEAVPDLFTIAWSLRRDACNIWCTCVNIFRKSFSGVPIITYLGSCIYVCTRWLVKNLIDVLEGIWTLVGIWAV